MRTSLLSRRSFTLVLACLGLINSAQAGLYYQLDRPAAAPGDTVTVQAIYFNDENAAITWAAPPQLVLQWRDPQGHVVRSLAKLQGSQASYSIPVNTFARLAWSAVVPTSAQGLQAVSIEGQAAMMALEASRRDNTPLVSAPALNPVVDASTGQPVPAAVVAQTGSAVQKGPAPESSLISTAETATAFTRFRSAISAYKPVYFDIGTRGQVTARFQLSAKYRLFNPTENQAPTWHQNFYLAYTQTSLWDLQSESMPFIDTTFNPSFFWLSDNLWLSKNQNWQLGVNTGVEHNSNGKAGADSRSINSTYIQPQLSYRFDNGNTLSLFPKIKAYFSVADENADYAQYAGRIDWQVRWAQQNGAVVSVLYRQGDKQRRTSQLDFAWPLQRTWLNMNGYLHLQYFNGYGETLLGYNRRNDSQFRIGLSVIP